MAFGCSGQSMPKPHSAPCSLWLIRPRLHALGLAMASPNGCGCQANGQLNFFWILHAQRLVTGSHGGLAAKLEDERESFLALVSKTRTKLLKAFPLHEVPDRVENCRNAFFWMRQHLHGTGVAKCLQDLNSLGHFDDNQLDRLRCSPRPSHCHRVAAANARC